MPLSLDAVKTLCTDLLGTNVDTFDFPGGNSRESIRVTVGTQSLIVTHRKNLQRAKLESAVLRILNQDNAPVPRLIACKGHYLIQQDVGNQRLSQALKSASDSQLYTLLNSALKSLHSIQEAGKTSIPLQSLVHLGRKPQWLATFVRAAERLGALMHIPAPTLEYDKLIALLSVDNPCFIKWDARPGNAVIREDGQLIWIDWEHCGRRHPLDDVAWLLTDEYTPYQETVESELVNNTLAAFANGYSSTRAAEYLRVYGTFHACIRLTMILRHQAKSGWWDYEKCLALDRIGVVQALAIQVCERASAWSGHSPVTLALRPWFDTLRTSLGKM